MCFVHFLWRSELDSDNDDDDDTRNTHTHTRRKHRYVVFVHIVKPVQWVLNEMRCISFSMTFERLHTSMCSMKFQFQLTEIGQCEVFVVAKGSDRISFVHIKRSSVIRHSPFWLSWFVVKILFFSSLLWFNEYMMRSTQTKRKMKKIIQKYSQMTSSAKHNHRPNTEKFTRKWWSIDCGTIVDHILY